MVAVAMDEDGLRVDVLAERLADGLRPKFLYIDPRVPEPDRADAAARAAPRAGRALPPPRRADLRGRRLPRAGLRRRRRCRRCGRSRPDVVLQAGTFSKSFFPGVRLGWAVGPARGDRASWRPPSRTPTSAPAASGSGCSRSTAAPGHFERHLPAARALYASHWAALSAALRAPHARRGRTGREPTGGFLTWLTLPAGARRARAAPGRDCEAGVAYVPGPPFHVGDGGAEQHAAVVQPPDRGRARDRRRAAGRRGSRRARAASVEASTAKMALGPQRRDTGGRMALLWTQKQDVGPAGRILPAMTFDASRQRTVLFGGRGHLGVGRRGLDRACALRATGGRGGVDRMRRPHRAAR